MLVPSLYEIASIGVFIDENKIFLLDTPVCAHLVATEGVKERKPKNVQTKKGKIEMRNLTNRDTPGRLRFLSI